MKNILKFFVSLASFLFFIAGLYFLVDMDFFYAVGFSLLLLAHELGHVVALKNLGGELRGVYFFPFIGAITVGKNNIDTENKYASFKYGGPFFGTLGVLMALGYYFFSTDSRFLVLVFIGAIFNLINMIPITFLDGYGMTRGLAKNLEWFGFLIVVVLGIFIFHEYMLALVLLLIFTLINESPMKEATGFKIHEVILSVIFISAMIIISFIDKENLFWNISYICISLFIFGIYIKKTCFDNEVVKQDDIENKLIPLTKKEKAFWGIAWILTSSILIVIVSYANRVMQ